MREMKKLRTKVATRATSAVLGTAILGGALVGCGGSQGANLVNYNATTVFAQNNLTVSGYFAGPGGRFIIGDGSTSPFIIQFGNTLQSGFNAQSGTRDTVTDVDQGGVMVGFDADAAPGSGGLRGNAQSWGVDDFGLTLGTDRLRLYAIAGTRIAALRVPATGAATVIRRTGTTNAAFTNPTNFRPTEVTDINATGKIIGNALLNTENRAFMTDSTTTLVDLGVGTARGMNDAGIVVGTNQFNRPYRTSSGTSSLRVALPLLPGFTIGEAMDINNDGVIVGWQAETTTSPRIPVAWYTNGALVDLRTRVGLIPASTELREAIAIDDSGNILVRGIRTDQGNAPTGLLLDVVTTGSR